MSQNTFLFTRIRGRDRGRVGEVCMRVDMCSCLLSIGYVSWVCLQTISLHPYSQSEEGMLGTTGEGGQRLTLTSKHSCSTATLTSAILSESENKFDHPQHTCTFLSLYAVVPFPKPSPTLQAPDLELCSKLAGLPITTTSIQTSARGCENLQAKMSGSSVSIST